MQNRFWKKGLVIGIIILFVGAGILPSTIGIKKEKLQIQTIGSRGYIQGLIDNASDGDTIFIPSGIYYENIVINKSISLVGENKNTTIIDGMQVSGPVIHITENWVNFSSFTIQNISDYYFLGGIGIGIESNFNNIFNNIILLNYFSPGSGIHIFKSFNNNTIYNNKITDAQFPYPSNKKTFFSYSKQKKENCLSKIKDELIIHKNYNDEITYNYNTENWEYGEGIRAKDSCHNIIRENVIEYFGIDGNGDFHHNIIIDNKISAGEGIGISISGEYNLIKNNNISEYGVSGISIFGSIGKNIITNNNIWYCGEGIYLICENNTFSHNNIFYNGKGVFSNFFNNNIFYKNNFFGNHENAFVKGGNIWDEGEYGNFWDNYAGKDADGDGIGDTPHPIPYGGDEDICPLMDPARNVPPLIPIINGPANGKPNIEYDFILNTTDLNDDPLMYYIDWGDNKTEWTEYSESGVEIKLKHTWDEKGDFIIKARAKDVHGAIGEWGTFRVTMPYSFLWFNNLLDRFLLLNLFFDIFGRLNYAI
jgi:nitrous oxidase accessory protein